MQKLAPLLLVILSLVVYYNVCRFDFVNYDDLQYIVQNPNVNTGLTFENIKWAFSNFYASNWHPVTWISHMIDCELFGTNAGWHHCSNLFLHVANVLLLFFLLRRMTNNFWPAFFTALVFAVHPLQVESVAWVSERKNVLSTLFFFLTLYGYYFYTQNRKKKWYFVTVFFFCLGLAAKPMLVTVPFVFLLLDFWPLHRMERDSNRTSVYRFMVLTFEKIPFFVLSGVSIAITMLSQSRGGAVQDLNTFPFGVRIANAFTAYVSYIRKFLLPVDLAIPYPHPGADIAFSHLLLSAAVLFVLTAFVVMYRKKSPGLLVGWLWFLGILVPVIGLVQVGSQAMADRYMYIPLIGLCFMVFYPLSIQKYFPIMGLLLAGFLPVSYNQVWVWQDSISLFTHSIEKTGYNELAHSNLGVAYAEKKDWQNAGYHFRQVLKRDADNASVLNNVGYIYLQQQKYDSAAVYLEIAIQLAPNSPAAFNNLGKVCYFQGRLDRSIELFSKAVDLYPGFTEAENNLKFAGERLKTAGEH